jgi:hypothetical protein
VKPGTAPIWVPNFNIHTSHPSGLLGSVLGAAPANAQASAEAPPAWPPPFRWRGATMATSCVLTLWIDGRKVVSAPFEWSTCNEATVRIAGGPLAACAPTSSLRCAVSCDELPTSGFDLTATPELEDWVTLGSRQGRCCLGLDAPGFTVCFDACMDAHRRELSAVRVVRHAQQSDHAVVPALASESMAAGRLETRDRQDECCFEVGAEALPTLAHSVHGAWLRSPDARPKCPAAQVWSAVLAPAALEALREDALALVLRHGGGGKTYWQDVTTSARCSLERAALEVLQFHTASASILGTSVGTAGASDTEFTGAEFTGAEWWVQLRNAPPVSSGEGVAYDDDASSIAFHFDCDEGLYSATGELVPPFLSTVTYLSSAGAPTIVLPARADACGDAVPTGGGAFVSFPHAGKHLCFDGTLLHGCPHALAVEMEAEIRPEISEISEIRAECRRLTLLVNLWRRHRPAGPRPLPRRVAESLGGADTSVPPPALLLSRSCATGGGVITVEPGAGCGARCFAPSDARRALSPAAQTAHATHFPTAAAIVAAARSSRGVGREGLVHAPAVEVATSP